jgi:LPXTG-motif cell wall-anchored protein
MKKSIRIITALITIFALSVSIYANDEPPLKKTQIDWLISGAGGCLETAGSPVENGTGEFSYDFISEDGRIRGSVSSLSRNNGTITFNTCVQGRALAETFTKHFANLTRAGHFHASHALSERSTEEYPVEINGETVFITFCYASVENGGMMSAMILGDTVKFVSNLKSTAIEATQTPPPTTTTSQNQSNTHNNSQNNTNSGDKDLDTGITGIAIIGGVAVLAAGAAILSRKRRKS